MELTFFPGDYDFDNELPLQNSSKHNQLRETTLVKVRPRTQGIQQKQNQSNKENDDDLIFAFENNQGFQQDAYCQVNEKQVKEEHKLEQTQQICERTFDQLVPREKKIKQEPTLDLLYNKNTFVIERILFFPHKFFLYDQNKNLLICAKKKLIQINSLFYFYNNVSMDNTKKQTYLGYMTSDSINQYKLYAADDTPLASFQYLIRKNTPGEIIICIVNKNLQSKKSLAERVIKQPSTICFLHNRQPSKNYVTGKYSTCLQGLGKVPSIKNCAIVFKQKSSLIMGKQKQKHYNLHYGKPWNDLIALAFAISNYEQKDIDT